MTSEQSGAVPLSPDQRTPPARLSLRTLTREHPGDMARLELRVTSGPDGTEPSAALTVSVPEAEDLIAQLQAFVARAGTPASDQRTRHLQAIPALTLGTTR